MTETETDVILVRSSSELVTATDTAVIVYMWRLAGRKTRFGTLIKGQLNIVHVHDEVSVLSDVALPSLSKGKGRPVTFFTVYRYKDNKEGALPLRTCPLLQLRLRKLLMLLMLLLLFGCGWLLLLLVFLLLAVMVVVVLCGWALCDVPLRRCVAGCRVEPSSLSLVLSSLCVVVPCRSQLVE